MACRAHAQVMTHLLHSIILPSNRRHIISRSGAFNYIIPSHYLSGWKLVNFVRTIVPVLMSYHVILKTKSLLWRGRRN